MKGYTILKLTSLSVLLLLIVGQNKPDSVISIHEIDCSETKPIWAVSLPNSGYFEASGNAHKTLDVILRNEYFINRSVDFIRVFEGNSEGVCLNIELNSKVPVSEADILSKLASEVGLGVDATTISVRGRLLVHPSIKDDKIFKWDMNLVHLNEQDRTGVFVQALGQNRTMFEKFFFFRQLLADCPTDADKVVDEFVEHGFLLQEKDFKVKDLYLVKL